MSSLLILNNYIEQNSNEIICEILPNISSILSYLLEENNFSNKFIEKDDNIKKALFLLNYLKNNQKILIYFYKALINCGNLFCFCQFLKLHLIDMLKFENFLKLNNNFVFLLFPVNISLPNFTFINKINLETRIIFVKKHIKILQLNLINISIILNQLNTWGIIKNIYYYDDINSIELLIKLLTTKNQPINLYDCFCLTLIMTNQFKLFSIFYEFSNLKWIENCWKIILFDYSNKIKEIKQNEKNEDLLFPKDDLKVENVDSNNIKDILENYKINKNKIYKNFSTPRGLALIINNYNFLNKQNREGTQIDEANLLKLFKQLGYKIIIERDLTANQMLITIDKFAQKEEHLFNDSAIVVILSHGESNKLLGIDESSVNFYSFVSCLFSNNAPNLKGKPKIIIVQACRGTNFDIGVKHILNDTEDEEEEYIDGLSFSPFSILSKYITNNKNNNNSLNVSSIFRSIPPPTSGSNNNKKRLNKPKIVTLPTDADILIASSTTLNNVSWRNSCTGSWFIQTLCEVFSKRAKHDDILEMMTNVINEVSKKESNSDKYKQIPELSTTFRKRFFFFPGITNK